MLAIFFSILLILPSYTFINYLNFTRPSLILSTNSLTFTRFLLPFYIFPFTTFFIYLLQYPGSPSWPSSAPTIRSSSWTETGGENNLHSPLNPCSLFYLQETSDLSLARLLHLYRMLIKACLTYPSSALILVTPSMLVYIYWMENWKFDSKEVTFWMFCAVRETSYSIYAISVKSKLAENIVWGSFVTELSLSYSAFSSLRIKSRNYKNMFSPLFYNFLTLIEFRIEWFSENVDRWQYLVYLLLWFFLYVSWSF